MQTRRFSKYLFFLTAIFSGLSVEARSLESATRSVNDGFKSPSYNTNFPSEQLFSIADIKRKTYKITESKSLRITRSGTYDPKNELTGSPMFKVLASTVIIDLNGQVVTKFVNDGGEVRSSCIEIGYSPNDANYSLDGQPQNVIIRNGTIDNFDVGLIVHQGVKSVRLENVTFSRSPIGVVFMGSGGAGEEVASCSMHNVKIIGAKLDESGASGALEWARTKFEGSSEGQFNYGADSFMNKANPVTGVDVSVYFGVMLRYVNNIMMQNVLIDSIGYRDASSEKNTVTYGIDIHDAHNVFLEGVHSSNNISPAEVVGCHIEDCTSVSLKDCAFNNNLAQFVSQKASGADKYRRSIGLYMESVHAATLEKVACNKNEANNEADTTTTDDSAKARSYGLLWETGNALTIKNLECIHNEANSGFCYGMKFDTTESVTIDGVVADYNHGTGGDVTADDDDTNANNMGATGISFSTSVKSISLNNGSANSNYGSSVIGLRMVAGEGVTIKNFHADYNNGTDFVKGAAFNTSIKSLVLEDISMVSNTTDGSGTSSTVNALTFDAAQSVTVKDGVFNYNTTTANDGDVTVIEFTDTAANDIAKTITFENIQASNNAANGNGVIKVLDVDYGESIALKNVQFNSNTGGGASNLLDFTNSIKSLEISKASINSNAVTHATNDFSVLSFVAPIDVTMNEVTLNNNSVSGSGALNGVNMTTSANSVDMMRVVVHGNSSNIGAVRGIVATDMKNLHMYDCSVSDNKHDSASGSSVTGIELLNSAQSIILNNVNINNTVSTGTAIGLDVVAGIAVSLRDVTCNNTTAATASKGISLTTTVKSVDMQNVVVNYTNSSGGNATGVYIDDVENLTADGLYSNHTTSTVEAFGFNVLTAAKSMLIRNAAFNGATGTNVYGMRMSAGENVELYNVAANQNVGSAEACGIDCVTSIKSIEMESVIANNNQSSASNVTGMRFDTAENVSMENCAADQNSTTGGTSDVYGMQFLTSLNALSMDNVSCNANSAFGGNAGGIVATSPIAVAMKNVSADYNQAAGTSKDVVGIDLQTSASAVDMQNVSASNNVSTSQHATGLRIVAGNAISIDGASCNYNTSEAASIVRGVHFQTSLTSGHINHLSADSNNTGIRAIGVHMEQPLSVEMNYISASRNDGIDRSYGLLLDGQSNVGSNVSVQHALFNGNAASTANSSRTTKDDSAGISKHLPVTVSDSITGFENVLEGGFGVYVYQVDSCVFTDVEASKNEGFRAGGLYASSCDDCTLRCCKTSFQQATGTYLVSSVLDGETMTAVAIPTDQKPTLFGDTSDNNVNVTGLTQDFLHALRNLKYLQDENDYFPYQADTYEHIKELAASQVLLRAIMAQFRQFSTAVGVQLHNCVNGAIEDHISVGNKSAEDSAVGIGITGTAEGHLIVRCKSSGNESWTDSKKDTTNDGTIDISATEPFWTKIGTYVLDNGWTGEELAADDLNPIGTAVTDTLIGYHTVNAIDANDQPEVVLPATFEPTIDGDRLAIAFDANGGPLEEFGPAIGGEAVGILVGDGAENIEITTCDCANNKGNAGRAFGIMQDATTSLLAKDNRCYQTVVNDLGYCFGLAEFTLQSNSVHVGNVMFSNVIGDMLNSNYLVPFDPDNHPDISFPVKIGYNGDIGNFANASPFDNLVIEFVAEKQIKAYIPNDMLTYWNEASGSKADWIA